MGKVCVEEVCVHVYLHVFALCSLFSHHISASLTLHPVIALGILLFSHAGAKTAACLTTSSVSHQRLTYWKSWD